MPDTDRADGGPALDLDTELIAYDEQMRQGTAAISTGGRNADRTRATPPAELVECLHLIERIWPRSTPPAAASALPSRIGHFEIERVLGSGGFGIVYLARDPLLNRQVALKVPRLHALANDGLRERFRREARATAALDHPHIVPIHETGEEGPLCYIAFAYCPGPSLAQWLKLQAGDVPPRAAAAVVRQLAEAMHYSHSRGILHRDLKPSNVLLFPSPEAAANGSAALPFVPRIVDFGLARLAEEELESTGTSGVIGTPLYMAPEQALGAPDKVGPAADLYALGVILYELLCRRPPFIGTAPLEVLDQVRHAEPPAIRKQRPDVPRDLETICLRCLEKRPDERYATAEALAEDLERFLGGKQIAARPVSIGRRLLRWCSESQRIREAGLTVMGTHLAIAANMFVTLLMVQAGEVVHRPASFSVAAWYPAALAIIFGTHVPLILVGRAVVARHAWAVWCSLIAGLVMTVVAVWFMLGLIPLGTTGWDEIPGFRIVYPLVATLLLLQTMMSAIALVALRQARRA